MIAAAVEALAQGGQYEAYHVRVALVRDPDYAPPTEECAPLDMPEEVAAVFRPLASLDRECVAVASLDHKRRLVALHHVHVGSPSMSIVDPASVYKSALLASAAAVVVVHNHPTGDLEFSTDDLTVTRRLFEAGRIIGIDCIDHVLVSHRGWLSMRTAHPQVFDRAI